MEATQVEEEFLLLVPQRTERHVDRRSAAGQFLTNILQAAAAQIRLHAHMRNDIEGVTGPRGHNLGQLRGATRPRATVPGGLTHGFASLKPSVLQADDHPADGLLHAVRPIRDLHTAAARGLLGGVEVETDLGRQGGGLVPSFHRLLLNLVEQGGQAQLGRFFSSV
jgi:hypothetical protein